MLDRPVRHRAVPGRCGCSRRSAAQELVDDPRFRHDRRPAGRNADDLDALVAAWVGVRTAEQVERELGSRGVAVSRVYTVAETLDDPHYLARGTLADGARRGARAASRCRRRCRG